MASLISLIPVPWRITGAVVLVLGLGLAAAGGAWWGYGKGYETAKAKGDAALSAEKADRERENTERALAVASAERSARLKLEEAQQQVAALESQLVAAELGYAKERAAFNRRINDVSQNAANHCVGLPADWVQAYNDGIYGAGSDALPGYARIPLAVGSAGAGQPVGSGVSRNEPLTSPADILAHARDLGQQYRRLYRQVNGWIDTHEAWQGKAP